ncbi:hypothetical protein B566_EDAN003614 [Ephemera danica]|nr:hypothetical protein B566_EDAN003614 [Ephemera danica]
MADDPQADCFTFRSNRYEDSLVCGLQSLLVDKDLIDVTFENPGKHPIVVMPDVKINHFQSILEFIYMGEVNVKAPDTMEFLDTAEMLKIKGLTLMLHDEKDAVVMENVPNPELAEEVVMEGAMEEVVTSEHVLPDGDDDEDEEEEEGNCIPKLQDGMPRVEPIEMPKLEPRDSTETPMLDSSQDDIMSSEEESKENCLSDNDAQEPEDPNVRRSHRKRIRSKRLPSPDMKLPGLPPVMKIKSEDTKPFLTDMYKQILPTQNQEPIIAHLTATESQFVQENLRTDPPVKRTKGRFSCQVCGRSYLQRSHVTRHHQSAHPNMPLPPFASQGQAKMINTSEGEYSCLKCGKRFNRLRLLKQHLSVVHRKHQRQRDPGSQQRFACPKCNKSFTEQANLKVHFRAVHRRISSSPRINSLQTKKKVVEENHNGDEDEAKVFKCPECPRTFARRNYISQHVKHVHSEIYYEVDDIVRESSSHGVKCPKCSKWFSLLRYLRSHYTVMHRYSSDNVVQNNTKKVKSEGEHEYKCPSCKKVFPSQHDVEEHFKEIHQAKEEQDDNASSSSSDEDNDGDNDDDSEEEEDTSHRCEECGRDFVLKVHLINHRRAKHPETEVSGGSYKCQKCTKSYQNRVHLMRHVHNIHGKYSHKMVCKLCKRVCMNLNSLRSHTFVHHPGHRVNKEDYM